MTTRPAFIFPGSLGLFSLASIVAAAQDRNWSEGYAETWEIVLPSVTIATVDEYAPELIDERDDAKALRADPAQGLDDDLRDAFQQSEGRDGWADSFQPMMDTLWPVELAYDVTPQAAADLMDTFAGSVSLIEVGEPGEDQTYGIALTGGGQDFSADIAMAYMCCGCVPPLSILTRLSEVGENKRLRAFPLADVYGRAFEWMDARQRDMTTQLHKITGPQAD